MLARSGVEDIRRSVHELKVDQDEGKNFIGSLEALVIGIRECTGSDINLIASGTPYPLAPLLEEALYRAAQESLTNAIRHGEASRIGMEIHFLEKSVKLVVQDNGQGCPVITEGLGLQHMRERSESLEGSARFTNLQNGFLVTISIPTDPGTSRDA